MENLQNQVLQLLNNKNYLSEVEISKSLDTKRSLIRARLNTCYKNGLIEPATGARNASAFYVITQKGISALEGT